MHGATGGHRLKVVRIDAYSLAIDRSSTIESKKGPTEATVGKQGFI